MSSWLSSLKSEITLKNKTSFQLKINTIFFSNCHFRIRKLLHLFWQEMGWFFHKYWIFTAVNSLWFPWQHISASVNAREKVSGWGGGRGAFIMLSDLLQVGWFPLLEQKGWSYSLQTVSQLTLTQALCGISPLGHFPFNTLYQPTHPLGSAPAASGGNLRFQEESSSVSHGEKEPSTNWSTVSSSQRGLQTKMIPTNTLSVRPLTFVPFSLSGLPS